MQLLIRNIAVYVCTQVSNALVFVALVAIGWWGHHTHWTLPWQGAKHAAAEIQSTPQPISGDHVASNSDATASHEVHPVATELPEIKFTSASGATHCGITTAMVVERPMDETVTASGVVGYDKTHLAQLSVRVPGVVWKVEKRVGDLVEPGDVLVIVDSAEVGNAKANLIEAATMYKLKAQTRQRLEAVQDSVAARSLHEAQAAEDVARAQRFNALQRLVNLGFSLSLDEIDHASAEGIAAKLHTLNLPESLAGRHLSANLIPLVSPLKGVVTHCEVVRGEVVDPDKTPYTVANIERMWINLDIRSEDCPRIRQGAQVVFQGEGDQPPVIGTLTWIGTEINPRTRTVQARAELDNPLLTDVSAELSPRRQLQANAFGTAHIVVAKNPSTVAVPDDALHWQWELGRNVVFVPSLDGRRFQPRVVRAGLVRDKFAQVVDGLQIGEKVVTAGSRILASELSEMLQQRWGDNAEAVRPFGIARSVE